MTIAFQCVCGKAFQVEDGLAGQSGTCPQCKMPITVPGERPVAASDARPIHRFPREMLLDYLGGHRGNNLLVVQPHIADGREAKARAQFSIAPGDRMVAGLHPSLLIGGDEVLVFTESGLYVKRADLSLGYVQYESLLDGSIHLEDGRDIVIQTVKPQRLRYRVLVSPGVADYLSRILRGLQLLLNGRDPGPVFAAGDNNVLAELRAERSGLLPSAAAVAGRGGGQVASGKSRGPAGLFGMIRRRS